MKLLARIEFGDTLTTSVLVGQANVIVSGKLAQFGSRLLVPVSDAMLAQFADHFRAAAAALPAPEMAMPSAAEAAPLATEVAARPAAQANELNALALAWIVIKGWFAGLFGKRS